MTNSPQLSLRWDAAYCAIAGAVVSVAAEPIARLLHSQAGVLRGAGLLTIAWAGILAVAARRPDVRATLLAVGAANGIAAVALLALAVVSPGSAARALLAAVALEVGAFAIVQLVLWRTRRPTDNGRPEL